MGWLRFTRPFDFTPLRERRVTIAYRHDGPSKGEYSVTRACASKALAAGAAESIPTPKRSGTP